MNDKEIADLWFKGCSAPEIAHALQIPEREVMHAIIRATNQTGRGNFPQECEDCGILP